MKLASDYVIKHKDRADFKHSSGYAKAQTGNNFGAANIASFEARKAIDNQRQFVHSYKSSVIGRTRNSGGHAKAYVREEDKFHIEKPEVEPEAKRGARTEAGTENQAGTNPGQSVGPAKPAGSARPTKPQVVLGGARAPQIPTGRMGI